MRRWPLTVAVVAAVGFALVAGLRFDGAMRWFLWLYFAPLVVPLVLWALDRWRDRRRDSMAQHLVDLAVVVVGALRAVGAFPLISGHALFLTYAILTGRSRLAVVVAALVMVEVVILKVFVWHDLSLVAGLVAGAVASAAWRRLAPDGRRWP